MTTPAAQTDEEIAKTIRKMFGDAIDHHRPMPEWDDVLKVITKSRGVQQEEKTDWKRRALDAEALNSVAICMYCGFVGPRTFEAMSAHAAACEKRPDRALWVQEEKTSGEKEAGADFVSSPTQNAVAPAFDDTEENVEYVWWGWNEHYPHWSRSCWKGKTEEEAFAALRDPMAVKMRHYANTLVRESKRLEIVVTSVASGSTQGAAPVTPKSSAPSVQQEDTVRLEGKDLGLPGGV